MNYPNTIMTPFRFLDLPYELRQAIYRIVLLHRNNGLIAFGRDMTNFNIQLNTSFCKQLKAEATPALYTKNGFDVDDYDGLLVAFIAFLGRSGMSNTKMVRRIWVGRVDFLNDAGLYLVKTTGQDGALSELRSLGIFSTRVPYMRYKAGKDRLVLQARADSIRKAAWFMKHTRLDTLIEYTKISESLSTGRVAVSSMMLRTSDGLRLQEAVSQSSKRTINSCFNRRQS